MYRTLLVTLILAVALVAGVTGPVSAQSNPPITCGGETGEIQIDQVVAVYNNNTDAVPSMVGSVAASNTTELQVKNAAQQNYTLQADGSLEITSVELGAAEDPNVIVKTDRQTACSRRRDDRQGKGVHRRACDGSCWYVRCDCLIGTWSNRLAVRRTVRCSPE